MIVSLKTGTVMQIVPVSNLGTKMNNPAASGRGYHWMEKYNFYLRSKLWGINQPEIKK